jgi:hypothetical protein
VEGTARAGRDRAAIFQRRSSKLHCRRAMTSLLRFTLRDGVSRRWQGHRPRLSMHARSPWHTRLRSSPTARTRGSQLTVIRLRARPAPEDAWWKPRAPCAGEWRLPSVGITPAPCSCGVVLSVPCGCGRLLLSASWRCSWEDLSFALDGGKSRGEGWQPRLRSFNPSTSPSRVPDVVAIPHAWTRLQLPFKHHWVMRNAVLPLAMQPSHTAVASVPVPIEVPCSALLRQGAHSASCILAVARAQNVKIREYAAARARLVRWLRVHVPDWKPSFSELVPSLLQARGSGLVLARARAPPRARYYRPALVAVAALESAPR